MNNTNEFDEFGKEEETELLKKINLLAHKAKTIGLTPEETKERDKLRKEYIEAFRKKTKKQIEKIVFVDENGNQTPIKKKKQ